MVKTSEAITLPPADSVELEQMKAAIFAYVKSHPYASMVELEDCVPGFKGSDCSWSKDGNLVLWDSLSFVGSQAVHELCKDKKISLEPCTLHTYLVDGRWSSLPIAKQIPTKGYKNPHWLPVTLKACGF